MKKLLLFLFVLGPLLQGNKTYAQCNSRLTSGRGTDNQSVCFNQPIVNITYSAAGADTAIFSLPQGIIGEWNKTTKVATLSGTSTQTGDLKYRITFRCTTNFADSGNIKVYPLPAKPLIANPAQICSGQDAEFTITGTNASIVNYIINGSTPKAVALTGGSATVIVAKALAAQTLKLLSVTNPSSGCSLALTDSSTITMFPLPGASISGSTSVCQDASEPAVIFKGSKGTLPYTFAYTVNGGPVKTISTNGSATSASVWVPTNTAGSYTYNMVSITDSLGCIQASFPADSATAIISIRIKPFLISSRLENICNRTAFNYQAISYPAGKVISWSREFVAGIQNPPQNDTSSASISETLVNLTTQPVVVTYKFSLSNAGCIITDSLKVTVNPTPLSKHLNDTSFCNGQAVSGFTFVSDSPEPTFKWSCNKNIGFGSRGSDIIPSFVATNPGNIPDTATVTVSISVNDGTCNGPDTRFRIIVLPTPDLISTTDTSICNDEALKYTARSSVKNVGFSWQRMPDADISPVPGPVTSGSVIQETLHNKSHIPVIVKYTITMKFPDGSCSVTKTLNVTVNPTPVIDNINNTTFCKGNPVKGIKFSSSTPNSIFTWTCSPSIGFGESGTGNIPAFIAGNSISDSVIATVTVSIKTGSGLCPGKDSKFTITVLPLLKLSSTKDTSVCDNFPFVYTAKSEARGISFVWERPEVPGITNKAANDSGSLVSETLHNETSQPVRVKYFFTLSASPLCDTRDSVMVTVNPTPLINPVSNREFCNGETVNGINFISASPDSSFAWTCDKSIGFGKSGNGSVPEFIATNPGDSLIIANIAVAVKASKDQCPGPDSTRFTIIVYPLLMLTSTKDTSVCDNITFNYTARSSAKGLSFSWTRPEVQGISNQAASGIDPEISESLHNTTSQPVVVKYYFTLSASPLCFIRDSVNLTVNPTPVLIPVDDISYCNGTIVNGINFQSTSPESSYTWSCDTSIGFGKSGNGNIPVFTATNTGSLPVTATITVAVTAGKDNCTGESRAFKITVNPSPPRPDFTWLNLHGDLVCKGSENINFNIISPDNSISYLWTSNSSDVIIRNANNANTAISFPVSGNFDIKAFSINSLNGGCSDSLVQTVKVNETKGIDERRIIIKQPGNLLLYPDNSMNTLNGYQWGYDSLIRISPSRAYAPPKIIDGQVYQFLIPENRFLVSNVLDTTRYAFWVLVQEGDCYSRVYYNGPYSRLKSGAKAPENNSAELKLYPDPNNGKFEIVLEGNIYGNVSARIYNSSGQMVFSNNFVKNMPVVNKSYNLPHLQGGLYFLVINSSDLKKVVARFIIQH